MAPIIGVRVAGSAVDDLQGLQFRVTSDVVDEHVELTGWLATEGEALSGLLHSVIGLCRDGRIKPLLVALRRAVFQIKVPADRVWGEDVRRVLPADLAARISVWVGALYRAKALEAHLPEVLAAEKSVRTDALREAVAKSAFRFGLLMGSPTLADALGVWIDKPSAKAPRGPVVLRLVKYLSRAVAKTSPYASFTFSGLGGWTCSGRPSDPTDDLSWRGVSELDRQAVLWIWSGLACRPEFREHIRLQVNPSAIEAGGRVCFLGAAVGEPVMSVVVTEPVRCILDFVRTTPQPTLGGLLAHLEGIVASEPDGCVIYADRLIGLGLLELCRPFADQGPDPLGDLAQWIAAAADAAVPGARGWHEAVLELRAAVRGYADLADAQTRSQQLQYLRNRLADLLHQLGQPQGATLPAKDLVSENAVITHPVAQCAREQWQPVFDDLDTLRRFLGIFNPNLLAQLRAAAFFLDRFGSGAAVGFLDFYRELHASRPSADSFRAHGAGLAADGPRQVRELLRLRQAAVEALYSGAEDAGGIVRVSPGTLAAIAASWPRSVLAPGSICCYAQELPGQDGPRLVLNTVRTGYGWGISRIQHLIAQIGERTPAAWRPSPDTRDSPVLLAECRAAFATNLNVRSSAVPYVIDYPRAESDTDAVARVSVADLQVHYDPHRSRLVLRERCDAEVRPLALGMLVEHALPPALRFLIGVFGEPQTALAPSWQVGKDGWRTAANGLRRRPRVEVGRIVLARAAWTMPLQQLPLRGKGESDAVHLLRFARWRNQHGIPRRCFARMITPAGGADLNRLLGKVHKPLYLDFANWFLLTAFERSIAHLQGHDALVVFEEALPELADAPCYGDHGQRVTEYIFEISRTTADD